MKRSKVLPVLHLLVIITFLLGPIVAMAQGPITGTGADTGAGFNGAGPGTIANSFANSTQIWMNAMYPIARVLFWSLATIDLTWTCITLVLQHSDLQPWMAGFIRKVLTIGFFAVLLENGQQWIAAVVNFFISIGGTAGGVDVSTLSASDIMGAGVQLAGHMLKAAASTAAAGAVTNPISLLVSGIGNLAPALILALGAFVIVAAYIIIALHFVIAMVEAYVVVGAGYIFLGFGGSRWTVPYTEKYMGMVVSAGVRIMVLELMIGLGRTLYTQWVATADAIATTPDILDGGTASSAWTGVQSEFGLIASIAIFALLCWTIPQIAANVASGGLSMSGGDALSAASAAGAAGFAGASFGSNSSPSNAGSAEAVQQIAQAAAMRGAELGVAAATGGTGAAAVGATEAAGATGGIAGAEAAAAALTPEPPSSLGSDTPGSAATQVLPPDSEGSEAQATSSGSRASAASNSQTSSETDSVQDAKAEASAAQADQATDRDARKANEAPGIDQAHEASQDAVRNAGTAARMEALAKGASPQEAVEADRQARAKARSGGGALAKAKQVAGELDNVLNKMPDDGGRMGGTTPRMGHGDE